MVRQVLSEIVGTPGGALRLAAGGAVNLTGLLLLALALHDAAGALSA